MKKKLKIIFILLFINIAVFGIYGSYSLYTSQKNGTLDGLSFAKIVFNNEETNELSLDLENFFPGVTKRYLFNVSNNKNQVRSEVNVRYNINIQTFHFIPTTISLYKLNPTRELIMVCDENSTRNAENKIECVSRDFTLDYLTDIQDQFELLVIFNETDTNNQPWSIDYSDIMDYIDIKINSSQMQ